jgi:hypothetical protein
MHPRSVSTHLGPVVPDVRPPPTVHMGTRALRERIQSSARGHGLAQFTHFVVFRCGIAPSGTLSRSRQFCLAPISRKLASASGVDCSKVNTHLTRWCRGRLSLRSLVYVTTTLQPLARLWFRLTPKGVNSESKVPSTIYFRTTPKARKPYVSAYRLLLRVPGQRAPRVACDACVKARRPTRRGVAWRRGARRQGAEPIPRSTTRVRWWVSARTQLDD